MDAKPPPNLIPVRLVPVEVFGTDECCEHYPTGVPSGERPHGCRSVGHGLMDAVQAWSDCNRASGHIYRFDDTEPRYRKPGETLTIWVGPDEFRAFSERDWRDSRDELAVHERPVARLAPVEDD